MKGPAAELVHQGLRTTTSGLRAYGHPEISVSVNDASLRAEVDDLLDWLARYVRDRRAKLRPGEYMIWGYWQLRFLQRADRLEIYEADPDGLAFSPGATRTLSCMRTQQAVCRRVSSLFSPPMLDSEARVSPSVLEGTHPLRARREFAFPPSSGWRFIAGEDSDEDLATVRICEVSAARPEIAPYLALVDGFEVELDERGERRAVYVEPDEAGD